MASYRYAKRPSDGEADLDGQFYDLARQMRGATEVSTSSFGDEIIEGVAA
jgi:hypothetical protein